MPDITKFEERFLGHLLIEPETSFSCRTDEFRSHGHIETRFIIEARLSSEDWLA
jgi:hypothetical protein